jgi:predicted outer membrane repeat protein
VEVTETRFTGNTAQNDGGAIYLNEPKKYESENCNFKDNKPDDVYEEE